MLRTLLLAPILAMAIAACGASEEPQPFLGVDQTPSPRATATNARSETTPTGGGAATAAPTTGNEASRGTPTVAIQGLAATAAATQPPAPAATPVPPTNTPVPQPTATPVPPTPVPPTPATAANCHASYPTVCIPPPPPDLDCGDIPFRRFAVVGVDPHRFDADKDGIGCES